MKTGCRLVAIAAVFLLALNDHVLKRAYPGFVTGKLSDVAGMIFFPVLLSVMLWALLPLRHRSDRVHEQLLVLACVATALVFTLTKTTGLGNEAYRLAWGAMQWPFRSLRAVALGHRLPGIARVSLVRDPSDVLAVPFVALGYLATTRRRAFLIGRQTLSEAAQHGPLELAAVSVRRSEITSKSSDVTKAIRRTH